MTTTELPVLQFEALPAQLAVTATRAWVDDEGGAPLRCCLRDSRPGELVALVAATPVGPEGAYRETGPVFVHASDCPGPLSDGYPEEFRSRPQVFRAYDRTGPSPTPSWCPRARARRRSLRACWPIRTSRSYRPATCCTAATC